MTHNVLTVDVEDWYHVCSPGGAVPVPPRESWRVRRNLEKILALLAEHCRKATFFMLGSVVENDPALAPMICSAGHEIASHGYSHRLVTDLTPQQFRDELQLTEQLLVEQTGQRPFGYRAPQWSLSEQNGWAFAILREQGYRYDSSLNPLPFVGCSRGSRTAYRLEGQGTGLWEIPPMVTRSWMGNLPTGGGWGFRFFPFRMICSTIEAYNRRHHPAVLYLHPREVDPTGPRLDLPALKRFVSYGTRTDATPRLSELFRRYQFITLKELVDQWQLAS
ncbi:MAG: polysaccharide deacetylase family protein [Desulfuromonadales bacterium]|nr:polysaccharide deacetylase family protein [Desulfuromonadales bacterium]